MPGPNISQVQRPARRIWPRWRLNTFARPDSGTLSLEELEKSYIEHILHLTGGVRNKAATLLGIDRVSLWRKMKKHGLA